VRRSALVLSFLEFLRDERSEGMADVKDELTEEFGEGDL
jgi:hypothetical protein